jgi:nucleotidyltransferase/DNA polymerase involved in DNA repair
MCRQGQQRACWSTNRSVATAFRHDDVARGAATRRAKVRRREPSESGVSVNCARATKHATVSTRIGRDSSAAGRVLFETWKIAWLRRQKIAIEKTGIDEFLVDVTSLVFTPLLDAHCDSALAPLDCWLLAHDAPDFVRSDGVTRVKVRSADDAACLAAARIAADLAALLLERLRFTVSIGVGANRSAAKAAASAHKPAAITVCFVDRSIDLMAPVPLRAIVGVGSKMRAKLAQLNCETCADLRAVSLELLTTTLDDAAVASHLFAVVRGTEPSTTPLADERARADELSVPSRLPRTYRQQPFVLCVLWPRSPSS